MAEKREEPFSQVWGSLNGRITIAVEGYYSRMICRVQVTSPLQEGEPVWEPESGIEIAG